MVNNMSKNKSRNIFAGADDIYLTKNFIAVRKVNSGLTKSSRLIYSDKTRYYKRSAKNMQLLKKTKGQVRFGRK